MLISSAGRPGDVCLLSASSTWFEDLGGIGAMVRLEQCPEPLLAEKSVGWIHGIGQAVGVNHQRLARPDPIGCSRPCRRPCRFPAFRGSMAACAVRSARRSSPGDGRPPRSGPDRSPHRRSSKIPCKSNPRENTARVATSSPASSSPGSRTASDSGAARALTIPESIAELTPWPETSATSIPRRLLSRR